MDKIQQYQQYRKLLHLRTFFILSHILWFIGGIVFLNIWVFLLWMAYGYISTFVFLAFDICPFCKQSFFVSSQGRVFEHNFLSRQCINCKMPHAKKSDDETSS